MEPEDPFAGLIGMFEGTAKADHDDIYDAETGNMSNNIRPAQQSDVSVMVVKVCLCESESGQLNAERAAHLRGPSLLQMLTDQFCAREASGGRSIAYQAENGAGWLP